MTYRIPPGDAPGMTFRGEIVARIGQRATIEAHGGLSRDFTPVLSGNFTGPGISARLLEGGGDWSTAVDGLFRLDARYLMQADNGDIIEIQNRGVGHSSADVFEEVSKTGRASLDGVYFRTTALFFTSSEKYAWLGEKVFVGIGREFGAELTLHIYEVH